MSDDFVILDDSLAEELEQDIERAMNFGVKPVFGKVTVGLTDLKVWDGMTYKQVTPEEFKQAGLSKQTRKYAYKLNIDLGEFSERARAEGWKWERTLRPGPATSKGQRNEFSADWNEVWKPSVETIFGKGSLDGKSEVATMLKLNGKYVEFAEVPQSVKNDGTIPQRVTINDDGTETSTPWTTVKLVKFFDDKRDEAKAAHDARFTKKVNDAPQQPSEVINTVQPPADWQHGNEVWQMAVKDILSKRDQPMVDIVKYGLNYSLTADKVREIIDSPF